MNHKKWETLRQTRMQISAPPNMTRALGTLWSALITFVAISTFLVGCGRETDESASVPTSADVSGNVSHGTPMAPAEVQPQQLEVPQGADQKTILEELNREVKKWVMRNRRKPANFEEVVSTSHLQVPPPPPGKKYVLNSELKVELADQ